MIRIFFQINGLILTRASIFDLLHLLFYFSLSPVVIYRLFFIILYLYYLRFLFYPIPVVTEINNIPISLKSNKRGFGRVLKTIIKKASGLYTWGVDVYLIIRYYGRYHEYSSLTDPAWPPTRDQVISLLYI